MSRIKLILVILFILNIFTGCFKLGYQIEIGSSNTAPTQSDSSGYYYKSPAYYTK
jgi:hypothetical protein